MRVADRVGNKRFHTPLYRNFKEHHHAGLPKTKFAAKYLKICATKYAPWQARTVKRTFPQNEKKPQSNFTTQVLDFCYRGHPPKRLSPLKGACPLKFSKTMERTTETIAYSLKTMERTTETIAYSLKTMERTIETIAYS